jgi:hypothetical protein
MRNRRLLALLGATAALLLLPRAGEAQSQELYTFTVGLLGGAGGSVDVDRGDDLGNTGAQLNLDMVTDLRTHVALRLGKLDLDTDEGFGSLSEAELTYATIAGEYKWRETYYTSGVYLGLGAYELEGTGAGGGVESDTAPGAVLGVTGEFQLHRRVGLLVELSGHWADFEEANVFAMGHAGLAIHF